MVRPLSALVLLLLASLDAAAAEHKLPGKEIREILSGRIVQGTNDGGDWRQSFSPSGDTVYSTQSGHSDGMWDVRGDQYCSRWPPGDHWTCYDVLGDGDAVTFVSATGERSRARLTP
jgi:hypothetical protein